MITFLILTEGGQAVGFGHLTRCLSLIQAFEMRGHRTELIINGDESLSGLLTGREYRIFDWINDEDSLLTSVKQAVVVVVDSYIADERIYKKISKEAKLAVFLDDTCRIEYPAGIVINWSISASELNYPEKENVSYLLGPGYSSLRKAFWNVGVKEVKKEVRSVMVTFGGDDSKNLTPKVLGILVTQYPGLRKQVVIGSAFKNIEEIEAVADGNTHFVYTPDDEGMKRSMVESDIAVCAGGQTLLELACVGVPTVAVAVAGNQIDNMCGWERTGFIESAGEWTDARVVENAAAAIRRMMDFQRRVRSVEAGYRVVPKNGADRIIDQIEKKLRSPKQMFFE